MQNFLRSMPITARILIAGLMIFLYCCNPVKKVLDNSDKTQQVVNKYLQIHPARTDTINNFIQGKTDTTVNLLIAYDTTQVHDTVRIREVVTKTNVIHKVDTVQRTIIDNKMLKACQDGMAGMDYNLRQAQLAEKDARLNSQKWKMWFFGLITALVIISVASFLLRNFLRLK